MIPLISKEDFGLLFLCVFLKKSEKHYVTYYKVKMDQCNILNENNQNNRFNLKNKNKKRPKRKAKKNYVNLLPVEIWLKIFTYCDQSSLKNLKMACFTFYQIIDSNANLEVMNRGLANLPSEIILSVFSYLKKSDLARCARVCRRFRDLTQAECLWMPEAKTSLVTNNCHPEMVQRSVASWISAKDRVRISQNWIRANYNEAQLLVQDIKYMPRIQIDAETIWVSWGAQVWAHPRRADGTVCRTASQVLRGHSDDVSRFVVKNGLIVSGGRDKTLVGWTQGANRHSYEFKFARRYCHGSEVSAVDVADRGSIVISGSRDQSVKIWKVGQDHIIPVSNINIGDRVWSLATSEQDCVAVGSAGLYGIPSLTLLDLATGVKQDIGAGLRRGAGMLDLTWIDPTKFLSCGYDSFARLWDIRSGTCVLKWEEPFNEAIYCMSHDFNNTLVCGTARHGLVRLWDMRSTAPVQMYHVKHPRWGQSSPVYSVAFDPANLYVALDQSLSLVSFSARKSQHQNNKVVYYR